MSATPLWSGGVVVVGCRHNTEEFLAAALTFGRKISGVVTLQQAVADKAQVPTWVDLVAEFGAHVPVYAARTYSLSDQDDRAALEGCRAKVGFCIGWQRLLPDWFLATVAQGVFGMHASQFPLPRGIGRSPINWGIIGGADRLIAQVFRYGAEPDSGDLLESVSVPVLEHDTVHTVQQKCRVVFNRIADRHWDALLAGSVTLTPPSANIEKLVYPKRTPADGHIDWTRPVRQVVDFVRGQTRPYPGAFAVVVGVEHRVWRCHDFGLDFHQVHAPGTVLETFYDGTLVIQAGDGPVHLVDHELPASITSGDRLT